MCVCVCVCVCVYLLYIYVYLYSIHVYMYIICIYFCILYLWQDIKDDMTVYGTLQEKKFYGAVQATQEGLR